MTTKKSILAKLLATENVGLVYGSYETASFDLKTRTLKLPFWNFEAPGLHDLCIGHEVGHALWTPPEGWHNADKIIPGVSRSLLNILEDIRIEKKILAKYPGLIKPFMMGYQYFLDHDFFGIRGTKLSTLNFIDRMNLKSKCRSLLDVSFSADEQELLNEAMATETWEDVLEVARKIMKFMKEQPKNQQKNNQEETVESEGQGETAKSEGREETAESEGQGETAESEGQGETAESEGQGKTADYNDQFGQSITDEAFRKNEERLLNKDKNGNIPFVIQPMSLEQFDNVTVNYKEMINSFEKISNTPTEIERYEESMRQTKPIINLMKKEFDIRKSAYQYARAKESKSGVINTNKLHSYRYNEDIFKRVTSLPNAKNHGLVMLVDFSGSMNRVMNNVIHQIVELAMFCQSVNIPYEIYGFTTSFGGNKNPSKLNPAYDIQIDDTNIRITQLFSSDMKKEEFNKMIFFLETNYGSINSVYYRHNGNFNMALGSTPLDDVLTAWPEVLKRFQRRHNVQKLINFIVTDGESNSISYIGDKPAGTGYEKMINMGGKLVRARTKDLLDRINEMVTNVNSIGLFIPEHHQFKYMLSSLCHNTENTYVENAKAIDEHKSKARKNGFTQFDNVLGYHSYFLMAPNANMNSNIDEFTVDENMSDSRIKSAFIKHSSSKKQKKVFATQFAALVS